MSAVHYPGVNSASDMDELNQTGKGEANALSNSSPFRSAEYLLIDWTRRILARNPFYLASAGFLLYGVNRLSSDPTLVGAELTQLKFNFSALLVYEVLLVITSIVLARRAIWYDSILLVGLENLFVLIPFSLVSRTVLVHPSLAAIMTCAAACFAAGKFLALKRYLPELRLSPRLLLMGAIVMIANAGIALGFHELEFQRAALTQLINISWLVALPLLLGLANFLPRHVVDPQNPKRKWLPVAMFSIWIVVTGCHLGGVGYVYGFNWRFAVLAPSLWALAWTIWYRSPDFVQTPSRELSRALMLGPAFATLLALDDTNIFPLLCVLNAVAYVFVYRRNRRERWAVYLCVSSLVAACAAVPQEFLRPIMPEFSRGVWMLYCVVAVIIAFAAAWRDPRAGLIGGVLILTATQWIAGRWDPTWNTAIQIAFFFVLAHSFRWQPAKHSGARLIRTVLTFAWAAHAFYWVNTDPRFALALVYSAVAILFVACCAQRLMAGSWASRVTAGAALAVSLSWPSRQALEHLQTLSFGYIAVMLGFFLFAVGTIAALTKHRWNNSARATD